MKEWFLTLAYFLKALKQAPKMTADVIDKEKSRKILQVLLDRGM